MAFVYYFRKFPATTKGIIWTSIIAVGILGFVQVGVIAMILAFAASFDLFFVNTLGMPFGTGILIYALIIVAAIVWGIRYSIAKNNPYLNFPILSFFFIYIVSSSFGKVIIRSLPNPPLNENKPGNVFSLLSFLNREQYGERPLLYGQYYNAKVERY